MSSFHSPPRLRRPHPADRGAASSPAQDIVTISGTVTTRADGLPVPGAHVSVVGSTDSVTTDATGRYSLPVPRSLVRGGRLQVKVEALGLPAQDHRRRGGRARP